MFTIFKDVVNRILAIGLLDNSGGIRSANIDVKDCRF
jgi:hypothetical protein